MKKLTERGKIASDKAGEKRGEGGQVVRKKLTKREKKTASEQAD